MWPEFSKIINEHFPTVNFCLLAFQEQREVFLEKLVSFLNIRQFFVDRVDSTPIRSLIDCLHDLDRIGYLT